MLFNNIYLYLLVWILETLPSTKTELSWSDVQHLGRKHSMHPSPLIDS